MRIPFPLPAALAVLSLGIFAPVAHAQVSTTTALSITPSKITQGQQADLSATVTPASGSAPSGTVNFYDGSTLLASAKLNADGAASVSLSSAGVEPGTYSVTAKYAGDSSDDASASSPVSATVIAETTTTLASASSSYILGQSATLTATVASHSGTPTGSVGFYYGSILLGTATLKSGTASITEAIPANYEPGTYAITAKYSGSTTFAASSGTLDISLNFEITPGGAAISPSATAKFSLTPSAGTATWYVNNIAGGNSTVGTISSTGLYTAPAATAPLSASITATISTQPHYTVPAVPVYVIPAGVVAKTANGQVASYTINLPAGATVSAQFGTTTSYGLNTWSLPAPSGGGSTQLLVAGMMPTTLYHIQGLVTLPGGLTFTDNDDSFTTTRSTPAYYVPTITVTTNPDFTPQPGVEFLDQLSRAANIFDLDGNSLWGWSNATTGSSPDEIHPFKLMPNGHLLINEAPDSTYQFDGGSAPNTIIEVFEVDYANTVYHQLPITTLQANLNASGYLNSQGQQIVLADIHHDVTVNPTNGHWLLITNIIEFLSGIQGYPKGVNVLGDVIIDVDPNNNYSVDWVWNEFDHLDINRQPLGFPDWTHTNAVVYSADDHNLLISMRDQNWVVKVNYNDTAGDGSILWHLGYEGDFTLVGGTGTQDWQYAQHAPSFTTPNTTGVFGLTLMDNGNDRVFPKGFTCPVALTGGVCLYSRVPVFTIDESAMTATLSNGGPGATYSYYGGNAEMLANGNLEADYCSNGSVGGSLIQETTLGSNPQVVWQLTSVGAQYRAFRQPSLYPGVTWSSDALRSQSEHATHLADR